MMNEWKSQKPIYIFCPLCGDKAWIIELHELHKEGTNVDSVDIGGVHVIEDFVTTEEEQQLVRTIDTRKPWTPSQEGRRKQDYGPKVSFLKRKVSVGDFGGFPNFAVNLFKRMSTRYPDLLNDFVPVEFCLLEYTPERGSYIRPHYDDKWIWGDRLITVNLLSETCLRLTREYKIPPYEIIIKMPARSLIVIRGEARYEWHHSINRYDIKSRRIAMTWREFGDEIVKDEEYKDFVMEVFQLANQVDETSPINTFEDCG
jgi:alkylated DNA repair protein alkB family protein 4